MAKNRNRADRREQQETVVAPMSAASMLPPLPSEVVAAQEAQTGVEMSGEERLAALQAAANAPPTIPVAIAATTTEAEEAKTIVGRRNRYSTEDLIVVRRTNPKRPGTAGYDRFAVYQTGMSVDAYMKSRVVGKFARADLAWDLDRGFISIVPRSEFAEALRSEHVPGPVAAHPEAVAEGTKMGADADPVVAEELSKTEEG